MYWCLYYSYHTRFTTNACNNPMELYIFVIKMFYDLFLMFIQQTSSFYSKKRIHSVQQTIPGSDAEDMSRAQRSAF